MKPIRFLPFQYVAELSLMEVDPFLKYLPSQIAAAAYCLANYTINRKFWVSSFVTYEPALGNQTSIKDKFECLICIKDISTRLVIFFCMF